LGTETTTTIRLTDRDRQIIWRMKNELGLLTRSEAIRHALRTWDAISIPKPKRRKK
jgi:hypothetical protein